MIWEACERVGIRPPGVKDNWDDNSPWVKSQIIAFHQRSIFEENRAHEPPPQSSRPKGRGR